MRGLDPRIHVLWVERLQKTWMAGTSPAMTILSRTFFSDRSIAANQNAKGPGPEVRGLYVQALRVGVTSSDEPSSGTHQSLP
jgi:hypothetical protein